MVSKDTKVNSIGKVEVRCKIDTGAHVIPISVFRNMCPATFAYTWKVLEMFKGMIKGIWISKK